MQPVLLKAVTCPGKSGLIGGIDVSRKAGVALLRAAQVLLLLLFPAAGVFAVDETIGWSHYGNDAGGLRYSAAALINADNVTGVRQQWIYRTGDLSRRPPAIMRRIKFETTPILAGDKLVLCSSFNEVIALDPSTGAEAWRFDPQVRSTCAQPIASTAEASRSGATPGRASKPSARCGSSAPRSIPA